MKLIVGLGNPGREYSLNRHNLGFRVVDALSELLGISVKKTKFDAKLGTGEFEGERIILAKPATFMNRSGYSVSPLINFYGIEGEDLLVVHDDIDLKFCQTRFSIGSGAGGHNGVQSIIDELGFKDFCRLRVGIGRPVNTNMEPADFVLQNFTGEENKCLDNLLSECAAAVKFFILNGIKDSQQKYND